jgi:Protein of unknown function (DUF1566)
VTGLLGVESPKFLAYWGLLYGKAAEISQFQISSGANQDYSGARRHDCTSPAVAGAGLSMLQSDTYGTLAASLLCLAGAGILSIQSATAAPLDETSGSRWTDLGNGVLKDGRTALQWARDGNGEDINWNDAKSYCGAKGNRWRLPTISELSAIYDEADRGVRCAQALCKVSSRFEYQ